MSLGVGIVGCGLIGNKRAKALGEGRLVACADLVKEQAIALADTAGAQAFDDYQELLALPEVDLVVVATRHDSLAPITLAAVEAGKHVLVEKPASHSLPELERTMLSAEQNGVKVHVGFNHRYHRAFQKARELFEAGVLGEPMFMRARYGHGGRLGYESEWRARPELSGGGELIDQGVHLIDLARWFLGDFAEVKGAARTYFWDMAVDDNAFMILETAQQKIAFLHVSCTEWKNMFSLELYGKDAKLEISGLGGSYGVERLTYYKMLPQMGPPETFIWEYPMGDNSWETEMAEFYQDILKDREPSPNLRDAYEVLKIVHRIHRECGYDNCA